MTASRLAAWMLCAAVGGAWLASAAGVSRSARTFPATPRTTDDVRLDALVSDVQAQAGRLRKRLASAPAPSDRARNPFTFVERRTAPRRERTPAPEKTVTVPLPAELLEPSLTLIGVAETRTPEGPVRTAMITGGRDDLMMVTAGQRILGRYDVVAVSADAVELKDLETGGVRRLVLR
jgi:hypothetical protein